MKQLNIVFLTLALSTAPAMAADCNMPDAPDLPKGASASMEDMLAGQKAVKAFQASNIEYMSCLEAEFTAAEAAAEAGEGDVKKAAQATYNAAIEAYNTAVSKEEEVAGIFNTEIRAYKEANK